MIFGHRCFVALLLCFVALNPGAFGSNRPLVFLCLSTHTGSYPRCRSQWVFATPSHCRLCVCTGGPRRARRSGGGRGGLRGALSSVLAQVFTPARLEQPPSNRSNLPRRLLLASSLRTGGVFEVRWVTPASAFLCGGYGVRRWFLRIRIPFPLALLHGRRTTDLRWRLMGRERCQAGLFLRSVTP